MAYEFGLMSSVFDQLVFETEIDVYVGRDKSAMFTITVYVNIIVYMYLHIDACAQVFSAT